MQRRIRRREISKVTQTGQTAAASRVGVNGKAIATVLVLMITL